MVANAFTDADGAVSGAQTGLQQDTAGSFQRDYSGSSARVSDNDKDTGADERYESINADAYDAWRTNNKRTYDVHQSFDLTTLADKAKQQAKLDSMEIAEREQRLTHQAKLNALEIEMKQAEHNQRLRHADFQVTALAAVTKEMVETISDRVVEGVCKRMAS